MICILAASDHNVRYPHPMDIVITHMGALRLLRLPSLADSLASGPSLPLCVPDCAPSSDELAEKFSVLAALGYDACPLELMVREPSARMRTERVTTHTQQEPLPVTSFIRIADGIWVVSPEHLCVQLATRLTRAELLVLMGELLGTYALSECGMYSRKAPCMTKDSLDRHLDALGGFRGARVARDVLALAPENSASPMETKLFLRVSLPMRLGGYALPVQAMNEKLEVRRIGRKEATVERRPDITLLPKDASTDYAFVALEYDGGGHLTRAQQAEDQRRSNEILAYGGREYRVNKELYDNLDYMDDLMGAVASDLGRTPRRVTRAVRERRRLKRAELKRELDLIDAREWNGRARAKAVPVDSGEFSSDDRVPLDAYWF